MRGDPVLVIHGVNNPNRTDFEDTVAGLSRQMRDRWKLIPVWWDPIGSQPEGIEDAIPRFTWGSGTRAGEWAGVAPGSRPGLDILNLGPGTTDNMEPAPGEPEAPTVRAGEDGKDVVIAAATRQLGAAGDAVRATADPKATQEAIDAVWPNLTYLPLLRDRRILEAVGRAAGEAAATAEGGRQGDETRFEFDPFAAIRTVLHAGDRVAGAIVGVVGEKGLEWSRRWVIPMLAKGAGDVLVYQRHRIEIAAVVRAVLEEQGIGTEDRPARILGHSLGGIVAFDLAVHPATESSQPVYWDALVTFGSQSAILHILDPRGSLDRYVTKPTPVPVRLPPTIRKWTNLFEPMDPLAFFAGKVFDKEDGTRIRDFEVPHLDSSGFGTHGTYWTQQEAVDEMARALEESES